MKESRLGVAATAGVCVIAAGVVGREVPDGSKLNNSRENWD